jgi:hypothetical protein
LAGKKYQKKKDSKPGNQTSKKRLAEIEKKISNKAQQPADITTERHRQTIEQFQDKILALEINIELVKLEQLDKGQLKEILGIIKDRKFRLEQESQKKEPASNGENRCLIIPFPLTKGGLIE